jgi:hypothetical protein
VVSKSKARDRRKRRTDRQVLAHGHDAKRSHRRVAGRTGAIRSKQEPSKKPGGRVTTERERTAPSARAFADPSLGRRPW